MACRFAAPPEVSISQPAVTVTGTELQVLANIVSALGYGGVIILSSACVWALQGSAPATPSAYIRRFLYVYIVFMFAMSTMTFIQETIYTIKVIKNDIYPTGKDLVGYLTSLGEPLPLPFTIWGADGFMTWRCLALYEGINPLKRCILIAFLGLLACTSLASGIAFFVVAGIWQSEFSRAMIPLIPDSLALPFQNSRQSAVSLVIMFCTTFVNLTLSLLIFFRLNYYQRYISKTLGSAHGSPYLKVITMCVESCALMVVFSATNLAMVITNANSYLIPLLIFPHICVVSPLLLVYRVAIGRSTSGIVESGSNSQVAQYPVHNSGLRFNQSASTQENYGEGPTLAVGQTLPNTGCITFDQ